ncbi:MAG: HPr family phosphocarrier protein [Clostridiales bacterium]|nr:HPr family phosphocarrier protein [Clostridiales bacterium]
MTSVSILLNTTEKAITFIKDVSKYSENMDMEAGRTFIDAKSMLGIFSLDLKNPVTLHIHADGARADEIVDELNKYRC